MQATDSRAVVRQPHRNVPVGLLLQAVGYPALAVALVCWFASVQPRLRGLGLRLFEGTVPNVLAYTVLGFLAFAAVRIGKGLASRDARRVIARSRKPPILYLRSFPDEGAGRERVEWSWAVPLVTRSDEEHLVAALKPLGPLVAIGKPGDAIPEIGAARMYVAEGDWQEEVEALLERSQLVVLRVGDGPGFWWEVERAVEQVPPDRLLFFFGPSGPSLEAWTSFRDRAQDLIPVDLPRVVLAPPFLTFHPDWTPRFLHADEGDVEPRRALEGALGPWIASLLRRAETEGDEAAPSVADASLYAPLREERARRRGMAIFLAGALLVLVGPWLPRAFDADYRSARVAVLALLMTGTAVWLWGFAKILRGRRWRDLSTPVRVTVLALIGLMLPVSVLFLFVLETVR